MAKNIANNSKKKVIKRKLTNYFCPDCPHCRQFYEKYPFKEE
jgi:hypothetical protein